MPPKKKALPADPDFIGPHCSSVGLKKSTLALETFSINGLVTNGIVIELSRYSRQVHLPSSCFYEWLKKLGLVGFNLESSVACLVEKREFLRRQKKQEEIKLLEQEPFVPVEHDSSTPLSLTPQLHVQETSNSSAHAPTQCDDASSKKERNLLTWEIGQKKKTLQSLQNSCHKVKEQIKQEQGAAAHYSKVNVNKRDKRANETRLQRDRLKAELQKEFNEKAALLQRISELENEVSRACKKKEEELQNITNLLMKEKDEKRRLQKKLSYFKLKKNEKEDLMPCSSCKEIQNYKLEVERLEIENDIMKEGKTTIPTRVKGSFTEDVRKCVLDLASFEVATAKMRPVIQCVAKHLFHQIFADTDLPHGHTCQNIIDEGHALAKQLIAEKLESAEKWGLHKDGTTRKRRKLLDTTVCLDSGEMFSIGFSQVASETGKAITDDTIAKLEETTADVAGTLKKLKYTMTDRASNEKKSNQLLSEHCNSVLSTPIRIQNFYCLAHVLLGFHTYSVQALKPFQKTLSESGKFGRDTHKGFKMYKTDEPAPRLCCAISDLFAPIGNHFGLRDVWEAYCAENQITSKVKNYKDNRFNALFHTSAATVHHHQDFLKIVSSVREPNKKIQAVEKDLKDSNLMSILTALGIMYIKVTEPYWKLVTSKTSYLRTGPVIRQLRDDLELCAEDSNLLLSPNHLTAFATHDIASDFRSLLTLEQSPVTLEALKTLSRAFCNTLDKQLNDFLTTDVKDSDIAATEFAPASNLICERNFGNLDASQHRRPAASLHHHTSVNFLKQLNITNWIETKTPEETKDLWKSARKQAPVLRKLHQDQAKQELSKTMVRLGPAKKLVKRSIKQLKRLQPKKRKRPVAPAKSTLPPSDVTVAIGDWVAVAYQENWFPGIVQGDLGEDIFTINFSERTSNSADFKWPKGNDVQGVHKKFILATNLDMMTTNGRLWRVRTHQAVQDLYRSFASIYF